MYKEANSIKVILLGEAGTRKTNLIRVCCDLPFEEFSQTSISSSFSEKKIKINETEYSLKLWDTAGQEKFRALNSIFIKESQICIFVYDVTRRDSFQQIEFWVKLVKEKLGENALLGVAGNKSDLFNDIKVPEEEGEKYAKEIGALFAITSAKADPKGFVNFVTELLQKYLETNKFDEWEIYNAKKKAISIEPVAPKKEKKSCC